MLGLRLIPCFLLFCCFTLVSPLNAQVTADYSANITSGCSPVVVSFTDQSTGNPTSWLWDFGNGNTSTLQNPQAAYVTPGTYSVTLTASGNGTDTEIKTNYITVFQDPTADLTATSTQSGCAPLTVSFQDISTPGSGTINQWLWDFGDGQNSTSQNPNHTYNTGGSFAVTLQVTDNNGCSNTLSIPNYVNVSTQPVADFGPVTPQSACFSPFTVNFTDQSTGGGGNFTYQWAFGDGGTSTLANPSHTYNANGNYTVTLIITDQNGCQDTLVQPNWVMIAPLVTDFNSITSTCVGQTIQFTDQTPGTPVSWNWDFGDGTSSTLQNPVHSYSAPGTYTVSLTASIGPGCTDIEVKTNWITITPGPTANFSADTTLACSVPFQVAFTDLSVSGGLPIVNWYWTFGDGSVSGQQNPIHTYTTYYSDTVTLTVTDAGGCVSTLMIPDMIVREPVEVDIYAAPRSGCIPMTVNFSDVSTGVGGIVSWQWDLGNGVTSTQQTPTTTYTTVGSFDITLIVTDSLGCTDTLTRYDYVEAGTPPTLNFSATPRIGCASEPVQFDDFSAPANGWFWLFGDGNNSQVEDPVHLYRDTGWFDVRLTVSYYGCAVDTFLPNYIYRSAPVSRFNWNPSTACSVPFTTQFTDNSIAPDSWLWDFGDGGTSTLQNPSHTYTTPGIYIVSLLVTNATTGCVDSSSQYLQITVPQPDFSVFGPTIGCNPFNVTFLNSSTSNAPIVRYLWEFGDGDTSDVAQPSHTYQNPGAYTVSLTIWDANNCSHTLTRTNYIIAAKPTAAFTASPPTGCDPLTVDFTDQSTPFPGSGTTITGWEWAFGDGGTSTIQNPQHTYQNPGTYSVILIITDGLGCRDTLTRFNYIIANSPTADFTVDDPLMCEGLPVNFTNNTQGFFLNYIWDFGDGTTSISQNPTLSHTYTTQDTFPVSLIVLDAYGCRDTLVDTVVIANPVANFSANPTTTACPPLFVNFTDLSGPVGGLSNWYWDFGDGNSSVVQNPGNLYATAGSFDVSLIVELVPGCRDTLLLPNLINVQGPSGNFVFDPDSGCTPLAVTFSGSGLNTVSYSWDFGDGTIISGQADTVVHVYTQTGIFYPTMILDDGLGCTFPVLSPDPVYVDTVPFPDFSVSDSLLCAAGSVTFTDLTVTNFPVASWYWDFGDGTTSTLQNPTHQYSTPGNYDVTLVVTTQLGCTDSIVKPAAIQFFVPPIADFVPVDTVICPGSGVPFVDQSTGTQPIAGWDWDFGNGSSSSLQNPVGGYPNPGNYTVQLIVTDTGGCADTALATVEVTPGPTAAFTADDSVGCIPLNVNYTAATGMGIVSWEWDLGNGTTGSGPTISTVYSSSGYYTPLLIVVDTLGCTDTLIKPQNIFVDSIAANFGSDGDIGCPPYLVSFFDSSYSDTTLAYAWTFGDGGTSSLANPTHVYNTPGTFTVTLIITSPGGCTDTIAQQVVEVYNNFPSDPPEIYRTTVLNNVSTHLTWKPHDGYGFSHYVVYAEIPGGSGNWQAVDSTYSLLDTTFRHQGLNTRLNTYCYKLVVVDVCGLRSSFADAEKHCTMDVTAVPGNEDIVVSWTPYIGFDNIRDYTVYRVDNYDTTQVNLLAAVNANTTTFVDSNLFCGLDYCYRIQANEAGGNQQISWSDTSCARPSFPNENVIEMVHATVEQNRDVKVEWLPVPFDYAVELYLERSLDNQSWNLIQTLPPTTLTYLDLMTEVQEQSYYYRVSALDSCGSRTQLGNHARSILLSAEMQTYTPVLTWNPYTEWANGVEHYIIEILNEAAGQWQQIDIVPGTQTTYFDLTSDLPQAELCYRVLAEELAGNQSYSLSNEDCVPVGPVLYAPNAFTPNGDGLNDGFGLKGSFIKTFNLMIFNRWGEKIFESNDLDDYWPGTFKGQPVQEGVYVFRARAVGENGAEIEKNGTVTLIR